MCRFALYLGDPIGLDSLLTIPDHSIVMQSLDSRERSSPVNGDGFGVAFYVPSRASEPVLFRSVTPAWSNTNLTSLAHVARSGCILAHVRAASPGIPVAEMNCHPFVHGRLSFMHNGGLGDFRKLRRALSARLSDRAFDVIQGTTDSELLFATFLDALGLEARGGAGDRMANALERMAGVVREVMDERGVTATSVLNCAVADGEEAAVLRWASDPSISASLYVHTGRRYTCEGTVCRMVDPDEGKGAVLVCSEPLSDDPGWDPVPVQHVVVIHPDRIVTVRPVREAPSRS
ncbi:MAG: class II glutamine amidotransferase [Acidobacteria bacterium]|nr:class II glutamine amidotransferase [Acidobacteriota bacterium]